MIQSELLVGDRAPDIRLGEMLKGDAAPVRSTTSIRVVECWSRQCPPCIAAIPHLTALQARYLDVNFIGVSIRDADPAGLRMFVADQGEAIGYSIATDAPPMVDGEPGWMMSRWLRPSYAPGIPTAYVVDDRNRIAWMGPPTEIDDPLNAIINGTWDIALARQNHLDDLSRRKVREAAMLRRTVAAHCAAGDVAAAITAYDDAFLTHPMLEEQFGTDKLMMLVTHDRHAAQIYGRHLVEHHAKLDPYIPIAVSEMFLDHAATTRDDGAAFDCQLADEAERLLAQLENLIRPDEDPAMIMLINKAFGRRLLLRDDPVGAHERLATAIYWAGVAEIDDPILAQLAEQATAFVPVSRDAIPQPTPPCEGGICAIAVR